MLQMTVLFTLALLALLVFPKKVSAHCDTMDGPTAADGKMALETNNIKIALKWVLPEKEAELAEIFKLSSAVRGLNADAKELADRYFLENLVRLHRAGEGEAFTGLKGSGFPIDEKVAAADRCIETGSIAPLDALVPPELLPLLEERLHRALALKNYNPEDVEAGRRYIQAYVDFFKTAEGEEHHRGKEHPAGHGHTRLIAEEEHPPYNKW